MVTKLLGMVVEINQVHVAISRLNDLVEAHATKAGGVNPVEMVETVASFNATPAAGKIVSFAYGVKVSVMEGTMEQRKAVVELAALLGKFF
jgi:hypothetical protein